MNEENKVQPTSISKASSIEEIGAYWDTHSLAHQWDGTREVQFIVRARPRHHVVIDPEVYSRVESKARKRGILPETLINL